MLPAGTSGWFGRATPGNDDATPVSVDFLNHVRGELKGILDKWSVAESKSSVTQIGDLLYPKISVDGRFSTSLYAVMNFAATDYLFEVSRYGGLDKAVAETDSGWFRDQVIVGAGFLAGDRVAMSTSGLYFHSGGVVPASIDRATGDAILNNITATGKIKNAASADVVFDDGIDVEADVKVRGKLKNEAGADVVVDDGLTVEEVLSVTGDANMASDIGLKAVDLGNVTCDWDATGTDTEKDAVGSLVTYDTAHALEFFDLVINNTTGGDVDFNHGETIFVDVTGHSAATLINAWCVTTAATGTTANTLMKTRCVATRCGDGSGNSRIAVMHAGAKAVAIPASNAGTVTVRVYLQYANLTVI